MEIESNEKKGCINHDSQMQRTKEWLQIVDYLITASEKERPSYRLKDFDFFLNHIDTKFHFHSFTIRSFEIFNLIVKHHLGLGWIFIYYNDQQLAKCIK